jgi:hypothetical protein
MAIGAVSLYSLTVGAEDKRRVFWPLAAVIAVIYLGFAVGYLTFAGVGAATSQNEQLFSGLPSLNYYLFVFCGAFLAPFFHLFRLDISYLLSPFLGAGLEYAGLFIPALFFCVVTVGLIMLKGNPREKRLCLWILMVNLLPFLLVSAVRYKMSMVQAVNTTYGVFTLMGALLMAGTAWGIFLRNMPRHPRAFLLSLPLLGLIIFAQVAAMVHRQRVYKEKSAVTLACYRNLPPTDNLDPAEAQKQFSPDENLVNVSQAIAIRQFLEGKNGKALPLRHPPPQR